MNKHSQSDLYTYCVLRPQGMYTAAARTLDLARHEIDSLGAVLTSATIIRWHRHGGEWHRAEVCTWP